MIIAPLIKKDYSTVNAYQGTKQVRETISTHGSALVISDEAKVLGVITTHDLATRQHNLVIDCLTTKPILSQYDLIPEVLSLMQKANSDVLTVYDGEELMGVVHKNDITDYLCWSVEKQKNLVHSIAHDLKNPLSNVMSLTYLMEDADEGANQTELIVLAQDACKYATGIINDLLSSVDQKKELLKSERIDLNELLLDCADSFRITMQQKQIQLTTSFLPVDGYLEGDRIKLKRAFSNLLSNAIKFTPADGDISIAADQEDGNYVVTIKDNGIGIPSELQSSIFDKFTDAQRPGTEGEVSTGLGMFITRQIIEHHGGKIWFTSEDKQGTAFYIQLTSSES